MGLKESDDISLVNSREMEISSPRRVCTTLVYGCSSLCIVYNRLPNLDDTILVYF